MMARNPPPLEEWFEEAHRVVAQNFDNIVLIVGEEGEGKSETALQFLRKLDPGFHIGRVYRGVRQFIANSVPTEGVTFQERLENLGFGDYGELVDEIDANSRRAMSSVNVDLGEYLKESRAMNKHSFICYPRAHRLDGIVLERVRWRFTVPRRGMLTIERKVLHERRDPRTGEVHREYVFQHYGDYTIPKPSGPLIEAYRAWKREGQVGLRERFAKGEPTGAEPLQASRRPIDHDRAVSFFRRVLVDQQPAAVGQINERP